MGKHIYVRIRDSDADDLKENSSSASDEDDECAPQKLTRAQRKRLRQKKLKETASCRRKIIGPQLPSPSGGDLEDKPPRIPHSAADELVGAMGKPGNVFKFLSVSLSCLLVTLQSAEFMGINVLKSFSTLQN